MTATMKRLPRWFVVTLAVAAVVALLLGGFGLTTAFGQEEAPTATPEPIGLEELDPSTPVWVFHATSPATDEGDQYRLTLTGGASDAQVWVRVMIMDHRAHENVVVLSEQVDLVAGEERVLEARNDYGTANHFVTLVASTAADITFEVSVSDASGQVAWYNERAFMQRETTAGQLAERLEQMQQLRDRMRDHMQEHLREWRQQHDHQHGPMGQP